MLTADPLWLDSANRVKIKIYGIAFS